MSARLIDQLFRVTNTSGVPLNGALLYTYEAGTTTPLATYSNTGLSVANANPIVSDSAGYFGEVFVAADNYKWVLKDADGNTLETADNIEITATPTLSLTELLNAQTGTSYTIQTTDRARLLTLSNASAIAITLPQADSSSFPDGWYVDIHNKGAGTATITPGTSTLDGLATYTMRAEEMIRIVSDGTNYQLAMVGGQHPAVNAQTGTTYAIVTGDRDKLTTFSNTAAIAVSLAQANTTTFKSGWSAEFENIGAGVVTITPTTSTINGGEATLVLTRGQRAKITSDGTNYQSVTYGDRVGKEDHGYAATAPQGWLVQNGDTVGSAGSGATKAAAKYQALYHYLWDNVSDSYAAVSSGRGASAVADFAANKTITLPTMVDKSVYGVGTYATGQTAGAATVASTGTVGTSGATTITTTTMPAHTHTTAVHAATNGSVNLAGATAFGNAAGGGANLGANTNNAAGPASSSEGSGGSHTHTSGTYTGDATSVLQPIRGKYFYIKY